MPTADRPDLEERLRRLPAALVVDPPPGLLEGVVRQGRRRRLLRRAAAAAAIVVLASGVLATRAVVADRGAGQVLHPGQADDATAAQLAGGRVRSLPPDPVVDRFATAATAWTGQELLVWGGASRDGGGSTATAPPSTPRPVAGGRCRRRRRPSCWTAGPPAPSGPARSCSSGAASRRSPGTGPASRCGPATAWPTTPPGTPGGGCRPRPARCRRRPAPPCGPAASSWWSTPRAAGRCPGAGSAAPPTIPWPTGGARWRPAHGSAAANSWGGPSCGPGPVCWSGASGSDRAAPPRPAPTPTGWSCGPTTRRTDRWTTLGYPVRPGPGVAGPRLPRLGRPGGPGRAEHHSDPTRSPAASAGATIPTATAGRPSPPRPSGFPTVYGSALVWTGAALVANGAAAYDPAADRWWRLPAPGGWSRVGGGPMVRPCRRGPDGHAGAGTRLSDRVRQRSSLMPTFHHATRPDGTAGGRPGARRRRGGRRALGRLHRRASR